MQVHNTTTDQDIQHMDMEVMAAIQEEEDMAAMVVAMVVIQDMVVTVAMVVTQGMVMVAMDIQDMEEEDMDMEDMEEVEDPGINLAMVMEISETQIIIQVHTDMDLQLEIQKLKSKPKSGKRIEIQKFKFWNSIFTSIELFNKTQCFC